jgi:hypothetical protein
LIAGARRGSAGGTHWRFRVGLALARDRRESTALAAEPLARVARTEAGVTLPYSHSALVEAEFVCVQRALASTTDLRESATGSSARIFSAMRMESRADLVLGADPDEIADNCRACRHASTSCPGFHDPRHLEHAEAVEGLVAAPT